MGDPPAGWHTVLEAAAWVIVESSPTHNRLSVIAGWGGGGKYHHTEAVETATRVRIEVLTQNLVPSDSTVKDVRATQLRFAVIEIYNPVMPNETQSPAVVDTARRMIRELRRGREALAPRVEAFTDDDLARQSACSEWDVSQVLSHLGSGAEIMIGTLNAMLAGDDPPGQEASEAIWARWNAMTRAERAAAWLEMTERHLAGLEALSDEQLRDISVPVPFSPAPLDAAAFVSLRLSEQALHHWDVEVTFDDAAVIPESAAELVVGRIGWMMMRLGKADRWAGEATQIALTLTAPSREWTLSIADAVALDEAAAADAGARLTLPSETFIRLVSGRLRDADSARFDVEGPLRLDDVVVLFPGY